MANTRAQILSSHSTPSHFSISSLLSLSPSLSLSLSFSGFFKTLLPLGLTPAELFPIKTMNVTYVLVNRMQRLKGAVPIGSEMAG